MTIGVREAGKISCTTKESGETCHPNPQAVHNVTMHTTSNTYRGSTNYKLWATVGNTLSTGERT